MEPIDRLFAKVWRYVDEWRGDPTGPWWEADLSLDIGFKLREELGREMPVAFNRPDFLRTWPPGTPSRKLGTQNHFRGADGRGRLPDFSFRGIGNDVCEWTVELKLWSLDGAQRLEKQVSGCLAGLTDDAQKCLDSQASWRNALLFLAVNIPAKFEGIRRYSPEQFLESLVRGLCELRQFPPGSLFNFLGEDGADLCVVAKTIDAGYQGAELVACLVSPRFGASRPPGWEGPIEIL